MKMDAGLNTENSSVAGEPGGPSQICESSVARPLGLEAATPAAVANAASEESSLAAGVRDEEQGKAVIAHFVEHSVEAEKISSAGATGGDNQVGNSSIAMSAAAAVHTLRDALAALDRSDYATAQGLFAALGQKDAAAAIENAWAALDRKDYATAQGLFEALGRKGATAVQLKGSAPATPAPPKPAASAGGLMAGSDFQAQQKPAPSPVEVIPFVDAAYRQPQPQAKKARARRLRSILLGSGLVLIVTCGAYAIYGLPPNWSFAATKSQAIAGLASAVDVLKAPLEAITRPTGGEDERSAMRDLSAALTQVTIRLDKVEHEYGARLDKLGERIDRDSSSRFADIAARLDKLEQKAAAPATPASELADVAARLDKLEKSAAVAAAAAPQFADITTRLNKLEMRAAGAATPSSEVAESGARLDKAGKKRAAVPAASSAKPLPPSTPKQSTLMARAEPSASNETPRPDNLRPLLRDYSVENVRDGIAVVDSRYGSQQVAPGDLIPGAGRVLRIERRGGDWFVLTSLGLIASEPTRY